jgi:hypothetical protein
MDLFSSAYARKFLDFVMMTFPFGLLGSFILSLVCQAASGIGPSAAPLRQARLFPNAAAHGFDYY